jgi:hypothetical protein
MELEKSQECKFVYQTLLAMANGCKSCVYMRELKWTENCDEILDMSEVRRLHAEHVGAEAMKRIQEYKETREDEMRAEQAVKQWKTRTERELSAQVRPKITHIWQWTPSYWPS